MKPVYVFSNPKHQLTSKDLTAKLFPYREIIHLSMQPNDASFQNLFENNKDFKNLANPMANQFRGLLSKAPSKDARSKLVKECKAAFSSMHFFNDPQLLLNLLTNTPFLMKFYETNLENLDKMHKIFSNQKILGGSPVHNDQPQPPHFVGIDDENTTCFLEPIEKVAEKLNALRMECIDSPSRELDEQDKKWNLEKKEIHFLYDPRLQRIQGQKPSLESSLLPPTSGTTPKNK